MTVALVYTFTYSKAVWHMPILKESPCIWPTAANNDVLIKPKNGSCQIWDASNFALWSKKREAKKDNTAICMKWKWEETTHYHYMEIKMIFPFTWTSRKHNKHFWNLHFVASRSFDNSCWFNQIWFQDNRITWLKIYCNENGFL